MNSKDSNSEYIESTDRYILNDRIRDGKNIKNTNI